MATRTMDESAAIDWHEVERIIESYHADPISLLMILQDICDRYQYLPRPVVPLVAERLGIQESLIYSVATFYKSISLEPRGKYIISVCTGTACHVRGADKVMETIEDKLHIKEGQSTDDLLFTVQAVRCLGCCASGPVVMVNKEIYGGIDRSGAEKLLEQYMAEEQ
jgi:NADH-quinone oxidoreductase subunit E